MKVKRREFNIFEKMELECQKSETKGPVSEFVLTPDEFEEFRIEAHNKPHTSFKKIIGRPNDEVGGDWTYRGALVTLNTKK